MSISKKVSQAAGGVAVVIPSSRPCERRNGPSRMIALLSDVGMAGQKFKPEFVEMRIRSGGDVANATVQELEAGPLEIGSELDIDVRIEQTYPVKHIWLHARIDDKVAPLLTHEASYVAILPQGDQIAAEALSVVDGELRLAGAPIQTLDYALIRLADAERPDLASMSDLSELREGLLAVYRTGDPKECANSLVAALDQIRHSSLLHEADRIKLRNALVSEHDKRFSRAREPTPDGGADDFVPWKEFVASLPAAQRQWRSHYFGPGVFVEEEAVQPASVHWNTRVLDSERALEDLFVTVARRYELETGLDPHPLTDALSSSTIASSLPDELKVTFEVSCPEPVLCPRDGSADDRSTWLTETATYDASTGRCGPVRFCLVPNARGRIALTLSVVTENAVRASTRLTLQAELGDVRPADGGIPRTEGPTLAIEAVTGPPAELRLQLTPSDQIVISDGAVNEKPRDPAVAPTVLATESIKARNDLVALSRAYRRLPNSDEFGLVDGPSMCLEMARIGAALHKRFFGMPNDHGTDLDLQRLAKAIANTPGQGNPARLQISAAFQPFPWAVLYDGDYRGKKLTDDPASVDFSSFWGYRFRIDRMIIGHAREARAPTIRGPARVQPCLNPHLDDDEGMRQLGVKVVDSQRGLFRSLGVATHPWIDSADGFLSFLESDKACDLLYIFCHATAASTRTALFTYSRDAPDTQAKLIFEPSREKAVDVAAMQGRRTAALLDRPLVFLNACSTAAGDEAFQAPFLEQFIDRWGAVGVIGTDWEVPGVFADAFARRMLDHFLRARMPLGQAFWLASREAFAQNNPFPLVYALYARPELTITNH